jgi:ribonucleoside-diphosphate reductase alpha chain
VRTAVRMLDNVIDINYYSVDTARNSNILHRPVGLGLMGFQDALYKQHIAYGSDEAVTFADRSMEAISYFAIDASSELAASAAATRATTGSLWSQGILPIDSLDMLEARARRDYIKVDKSMHPGLGRPARDGEARGMRNSNVMAIAPTATIANITGVSQSIEPTYQNLYVKSNLSGEFTVVNPYLVNDLKAAGLWDGVMVNDLKYYDGSVQAIERVPGGPAGNLCHRLRSRAEVDRRVRQPSPEVDRPGAVPESVHQQCQRQEARHHLPHGLVQRSEDHLLPALAGGDGYGEIHRRDGHAECRDLRSLGCRRRRRRLPVPQACSLDDPDCEACQ